MKTKDQTDQNICICVYPWGQAASRRAKRRNRSCSYAAQQLLVDARVLLRLRVVKMNFVHYFGSHLHTLASPRRQEEGSQLSASVQRLDLSSV